MCLRGNANGDVDPMVEAEDGDTALAGSLIETSVQATAVRSPRVDSSAPGQCSRTHITVQNHPEKRGRESRPLLTDAAKTASGQGQETPKTEPRP